MKHNIKLVPHTPAVGGEARERASRSSPSPTQAPAWPLPTDAGRPPGASHRRQAWLQTILCSIPIVGNVRPYTIRVLYCRSRGPLPVEVFDKAAANFPKLVSYLPAVLFKITGTSVLAITSFDFVRTLATIFRNTIKVTNNSTRCTTCIT
jgi:hypothetical protein